MNLTTYLKRKKLTQAAFAEASGVNVATVSRFLNGETMPSTENVARIERETDGKVTFADLLDEFTALQRVAARAART